MTSLQKLIQGYAQFHKNYLDTSFDAYRQKASLGQSPKIMIISCCDSRTDPLTLTDAALGDIFTLRNIANIVPPYHDTHRSTGAALEYAVRFLKVEQIIIIGHSQCGGIEALVNSLPSVSSYNFIQPWMQSLLSTREFVIRNNPKAPLKNLQTLLEKEALLTSLRNLATYPFITNAIKEKQLHTHAWYFDIPSGIIQNYNTDTQTFSPLIS